MEPGVHVLPALGIEQHRPHRPRVARADQPVPCRPPGDIGRGPPLQHHAPDPRPRRIGPQRGQRLPVGKVQTPGQVEPRLRQFHYRRLQPRTPLRPGPHSQVLALPDQHVVEPQRRRVRGQQRAPRRLAAQSLVQLGDGRHQSVAAHHQHPVQRAVKAHERYDIGKGRGNVLAHPRIKPRPARLGHRQNPEPVLFPFGGIGGGVTPGEILVRGNRRQHHRPEPRRRSHPRRRPAVQPAKQRPVGRR